MDIPGMPGMEEIVERLLERRIVLLAGPLDADRANRAAAQLLHLEALDPAGEISVHINCPGADLPAALALYDVIQAVRPPVRTLCLGTAAGGAALILAGGVRGRRSALPGARVTFDEPRGRVAGTAAEIDARARELLRLRHQVHELLARHTGQPLERIERDAGARRWFSAQEAKDYGFVDEVGPVR